MLAAYRSDGFLGRVAYGAQTRIMDGVLGRANCLVILTLWNLFKFFMVPLGARLGAIFPPADLRDGVRHDLGLLPGRGRAVRDRGLALGKAEAAGVGHRRGEPQVARGDRGLLPRLARDLPVRSSTPTAWACPGWGWRSSVSVSNTAFELFSPRGTDDFTMATANALLCWGFGSLVY